MKKMNKDMTRYTSMALLLLMLLNLLCIAGAGYIPFVKDKIAHVLHEYEHTQFVHKNNGKDHVHKEIATFEKSSKQKDAETKDICYKVKEYVINSSLIFNTDLNISTQCFKTLTVFKVLFYILIDSPPPRIMVIY
jgi:hypothetical protein